MTEYLEDENMVWLVTEGEYSNYHVVAVFDNKNLAKDFAGERHNLERWTLNTERQPDTTFYEVILNGEGEVVKRRKENANLDGGIGSWLAELPVAEDKHFTTSEWPTRIYGRSVESYGEALHRAKDHWTGLKSREEL